MNGIVTRNVSTSDTDCAISTPDYAYINEETLALRSGLSRQQVYETLVLLTKRHTTMHFSLSVRIEFFFW